MALIDKLAFALRATRSVGVKKENSVARLKTFVDAARKVSRLLPAHSLSWFVRVVSSSCRRRVARSFVPCSAGAERHCGGTRVHTLVPLREQRARVCWRGLRGVLPYVCVCVCV